MEKKEIKVSLMNVILIIIIVVLIGALIGGYFYFNNKTKETSTQTQGENSKSLIESTSKNENVVENNKNKVADNKEEKGNSINLNDSTVKKLFSYVDHDEIADYIYKLGNVNIDTVENDFKLQIGFANIDYNEWKFNESTDNEYTIETSKLDKKIKEILGTEISYKNTDIEIFKEFKKTDLCNCKYKNDKYLGYIVEGGGGFTPTCIIQNLTAATKYSDRIELNVKPIYFEYAYSEQKKYEPFYNISNSYNFETKKFGETLKTVEEPDNLKDVIKQIDSNKLSNYKYTFKKNQTTENYYFYSVEKM